MNLEIVLLILFVICVVASVAIRRIRRARLLRDQRAELAKARERKSTGGTLRSLEARHAFEREDITDGLMILGKDKPDS